MATRMRHLCLCMALLWSTSEAWMTPVTRNAAIRPLQATQLSNEPTTTTTLQSNEDDTLFTTLQNNPDTLKQMLQHVQSPQVCLEEMTLILLDTHHHPPGSLSWDVLDASFAVLHAWSKTHSETGARVAERCLERLQHEQDFIHQKLVTRKHCAVVVDAWTKSGAAPQNAERVLRMIRKPNRIAYNSVLTAYAKHGQVEDALRILQEMPSPELQDYNAVLAAHAKCGHARHAESLLREMMNAGMEPDLISYNCVLNAWAKSDEKGAAERALAILESLPSPNARSYSSVATAFLQNGAVQEVHGLLRRANESGIDMDAHLQSALLQVWAIQGDVERAQEQLEKMDSVDSVAYNTVIKAWKQSKAVDAPARAHAILKQTQKEGMDDVFTYTSVIDCYAKSKQPGAAQQAEALLEDMISLYKEGRASICPNTVTINCVLDALAKSGAASRAEKLLDRIESGEELPIQLNTISYTSVIDAYARSGAAQRAEKVFQRMEAAYKNGNPAAKPQERSFNAVMNAWVQSGKPGSAERAEAILSKMEESYNAGDQDLRPNVVSYSIVMNGWSKSGSPEALERTAHVFSRMCDMYKSGNQEARPNFVSFVTLIDAIVKNGDRGAAQRAEDVLKQMYAQYEDGNDSVKPNSRLITSVMDCWARSGARNAGEKAEALLGWMIEAYADEEDASYKPNEITFNTAINAWSKSRVFGKAYRAKTVLQKMIDMYEAGTSRAKPNTFVYTAVLNSCAYAIGDSGEKADALAIATKTFQELCDSSYCHPNHVTYAAYLSACRNLLPEGAARAEAMKNVFLKCCDDGQVDRLILRRLETSLTGQQLQDLYKSVGIDSSNGVDLNQLPAEWKRNVQEKKQRGSGKRGYQRRN